MWSRSSILAAAAVGVAGLVTAATAGGLEIKVTEDRTKACAKAEKRYKKLFPDAKEDPGVAVVTMYKYNFCPANLTVKVGTTVKWVVLDKRTSHSVWLKDAGQPESERKFAEESWSFTFQAPGDYPYLCGPHWKDEDMRGYVRVTP